MINLVSYNGILFVGDEHKLLFFYIVVSKRFDIKLDLTNSAISRIIAKLGSAENLFTVFRSFFKKSNTSVPISKRLSTMQGVRFFSLACTDQVLQYTIFGRSLHESQRF